MKSSRPPSRLSRSTTPHKPPHHLPSTTPLDQDHITVTPTTSIILQKCRPLPEDIASMSESDTACTFCGVSYLMLRKYEELVKHVANVEEEMRGLKRYAVENPGLVERICELECSQNEFKQTIQDLETTSQKHQETHSQTVRAFHELQLRHTRLTHEMETREKRSGWLEDGLRSQIRILVRRVLEVTDALRVLKRDVEGVKTGMKETLQMYWSSISTVTLQTLYTTLPPLIATRVRDATEKVAAKYEVTRMALLEEIEGLKEDVGDAEERWRGAMRDVEMAKEEFEGHLGGMRREVEVEREKGGKMEEKVLELRRVVADLRGLNAKLEASERDLTHRLNHDMDALHRENLDLNTLKTKLTTTITEKNSEISTLKSNLEDMQRTLTSHEHNTTANINRSLAQKDGVIHKLTTTIKDLTNTIETMKIERQKTVEAHQSRIKHLQDHFAEQLKTAGKDQADAVRVEMQDQFKKEREETVKTMKALFQKQLDGVRGNLQSQLDAARLSRDTAYTDAKTKTAAIEAEWKTKIEALTKEIEMLKGTVSYLQKQLDVAKTTPPPPPPTLTPIHDVQSEIHRRDAEIAFLKETVRVECEERMGLLALVDGLRRGVAGGGGDGAKHEKSVEKEEGSLYQSLASVAAGKKEGKLRNAALKKKMMG